MQTIMGFVDPYLLPASLWLVMFSMGLSLVPADFRRIVGRSRAFVTGVSSMLLVAPAVGTALAIGVAPSPALTMGFILLATCPGGLLSNLVTDLAGGDLALSVCLSLSTSAVYIFTLPFIAHFALQAIYGESQAIQVPIWSSMQHILMITAFPIATGMAVRFAAPRLAERARPLLRNGATWTLTIIFALIIVEQWDTLKASFGIVLGMVVAMNGTNFLVALGLSRLTGISRRERTAVVVEHLIRQETTAIYVAVSLLHRDDMSLPMIINTFVGMAFSVVFVAYLKGRRAGNPEAQAGICEEES
jgi:BASS family bile acid:Na+ symporter